MCPQDRQWGTCYPQNFTELKKSFAFKSHEGVVTFSETNCIKYILGFFFRHSLFDLKKFEETQKHEHFYFKWEFLSQRIQYFNIGRGWHQGVNLEIINSVNYVATQFGKLQAITYKKISHVSFGFINFSFSMLNNVVMVLFFRFLKYWSHFQGRPKKLNQMKN